MRDNDLSRAEWTFASGHQAAVFTVVCLTTAGRKTVDPPEGLSSRTQGERRILPRERRPSPCRCRA